MPNTRITGDRCIADRFTERLAAVEHEQCWLLTLTKDHEVIGEHLVAEGVIDTVTILPRAILRLVLLDDAVAFALIHSHPSNVPEPSFEDLYATASLVEAAGVMGLRLLDHVICTPTNGHYSFDKSGTLKEIHA